METRKIKIRVTQRTTHDGKNKFNTYKTFSKNGNPTEVKFRKDVKELPEKDGFYTFDADDMSLNKSGEYPVLWIRSGYINFEELNAETEESKEKNRQELSDYFG